MLFCTLLVLEVAYRYQWIDFFKTEFKAQFGVPVFKYLQNERLKKAHSLIKNQQKTIQEAAWAVGYESLGSFSNAFEKKFGYRPSQV